MANSRNQIVKLPGKFIFSPASSPVAIYSSTGWTATVTDTVVNLPSTRWGEHAQVLTGRLVKIEGTPTQFTSAALGKLYTHAAVRMGGSIVGATDQAGELHTIDGRKRSVKSCFIYQEPAIRCLTGQTIMGPTVIYGIIPLNTAAGNLDDLWKEEAQVWEDDDWDPDAEITPGWNFSWSLESGASAWDDIDTTDEGVTLTPSSGLTEDISNRDGLKNVTINNYSVDITAKVMNISESLVLDAAGRNLKPGQRKNSLGRDLKLNAVDSTAFIRAYNAVLQPDYAFGFDATNTVVGNLSWKTFPKVTAGVRGAHLYVGLSDPDV